MKNFALLTLLFFVCFSNAQNKCLHHQMATFEAQSESIKTYLNENYVVVFNSKEDKSGVKQHSVSWSHSNTDRGATIPVAPMQKGNTKFFGFHLTGESFHFFEAHVDSTKAQVLTLHSLNLVRQKTVKREIYKDKSLSNSTSYRYIQNSNSEYSILYFLKDASNVSVHVLDNDYNITSTSNYRFKTGINKDFNFSVSINNAGDVYAVHQMKSEKETFLVSHYCNVFEPRETDLELRPIYKEKSLKVTDYRASIDDNSMVRFLALGSITLEKTTTPRIVSVDYHPNKEKVRKELDLTIKSLGNLTLSHYLPINEDHCILAVESSSNNQTSSPSDKKNNVGPKSSEVVTLYFINHQKGIIWQQDILPAQKGSDPFAARLFPGTFTQYFWSDGSNLFALYYSATHPQKDKARDNSSVKGELASSRLTLNLQKFDLSSGSNTTSTIQLDDRAAKNHIIPELTNITTMEYFVSILQLEGNKYCPIQVFLNK